MDIKMKNSGQSEIITNNGAPTNGSSPLTLSVDAIIPPKMALKAEEVGVKKATMGWLNTFALAILAGAFIALGAIFATTVTAGASGQLSFGLTKLLGGVVFCLGLILVVVAGAELFTGNNLIVMAWADRRISTLQLHLISEVGNTHTKTQAMILSSK